MRSVLVFAPPPRLTVTIESRHDEAELHVHAGDPLSRHERDEPFNLAVAEGLRGGPEVIAPWCRGPAPARRPGSTAGSTRSACRNPDPTPIEADR